MKINLKDLTVKSFFFYYFSLLIDIQASRPSPFSVSNSLIIKVNVTGFGFVYLMVWVCLFDGVCLVRN